MSRKDSIAVVNDSLSNCIKCDAIDNPRPFYFSEFNPNCKVMIITWRPSIQAVYRPLFSTRFFRTMCLALFGANPERKNLVELFYSGEIFWTHLQKCHPERQDDVVQSNCAGFYIKREFKIIEPELVIVLGEITGKYIKEQNYYKNGCNSCMWFEIIDLMKQFVCMLDEIENDKPTLM